MKYIIKTSYPCVIKTEHDFLELDEDSSIECEDENFVYVYPTQAGIPFCIDIKQRKDCERYSFSTHDGQNFIFIEPIQLSFVTKKETLLVNGKSCKILIEQSQISFEGQNRIVHHKITKPFKKYKIIKIQNFACAQFDSEFFAFDTQKEKLYHFSGEDFSFEKNTLTINRKYDDNSGRERKYKVTFSDKISVTENTFVKKEQKKPELIPFDFLQAVKSEDFACATNYLSTKLKEKIGRPELESFFGKIQQILPIDTNTFIVFSNAKKQYVSFEIVDNHICDISLDDL